MEVNVRNFLIAAILLASSAPALASVVAEEQTSPAKGTKSCAIQQVESAYLAAKHDADVKAYGASTPVEQTDPMTVNVLRGGSVSIDIVEDTFPGTRVYVMVGGHRYSSTGDVRVPAAPLIKEQLVQFTYTSWPENQDVNGEDVLDGFAAAYAECRAFMG